MKEYTILITERLEKSVTVQALNRREAEQLVSDRWDDAQYVLDAENFTDVSFETLSERVPDRPMMHALLVQPGKYPQHIEIGTELKDLQAVVGGDIEAVYPFSDQVALIGNDEAKLIGLPPNRALRDRKGEIYDYMSGDFLVVGLGPEDFDSLPLDLMEKYEIVFHQPELFVKLGDNLVVRKMPDEMVEPAETPEVGNDGPEID